MPAMTGIDFAPRFCDRRKAAVAVLTGSPGRSGLAARRRRRHR